MENSIISAEIADNLACSKQFFTAEETPQGKIRAYLEIYSDTRWADKRAALMYLGSCVPKDNEQFIRALVGEGYAVCVLDYCGSDFESAESTTFPSDLSFAAYPKCKKFLNVITDSARNTPWFVWSKIARRALSLIEQQRIIDASHIGIIGLGEGAHVAWQVAAMDERVRALVAIGDGGYRWAKGRSRFTDGNVPSTDEERAYSTGVGAETYAKFVHCPTFFITSRTARATDVDRAGDIISLVKSENKQMLISGGTDTQITKAALDVLLNWLRGSFVQGKETYCPYAEFENVDGKLYFRMNTVHKAAKIRVFICYGEPLSSARHWDLLENLQKVDTHLYAVGVPVYNPEELIVAYATAYYDDGNIISTPVQGVFPAKIGIEGRDSLRESSHIIYDGSMGLGSFTCLTKDTVIDEDALIQATGPFDIEGITTLKGGLYLCRSAAEVDALNRTSTLHFDAYSPVEKELCVSMYTYPEMQKYTAYANLDGGEFWQKILLQSADFKSEKGKTLSKFSDTKILAVHDAEGVIFNNFLWI